MGAARRPGDARGSEASGAGLGVLYRTRRFLAQELWSPELLRRTAVAPLIRLLQLGVMIVEGFVRDQLLLRASALTYFSALALIPILAVAVSLAQVLGIRENLLQRLVAQVTAGSPEAGQYILSVVENVNLGGLGTLGAIVLFVTTVFAISNVETALNSVWGVHRSRNWARRFPDYLAMLTLAPLLFGAALALPAALQSQWIVQQVLEVSGFAALFSAGLRHASLVLSIFAIAFLYWFLPNTRVRATSALLGGLVGAILLTLARALYLEIQVGFVRYSALFGGFAFLPLLFVWIYVCWAVILLGAEVAYAHQNLALYRREVRGGPASPAEREEISLRIALEVARAFRDAAPPWTAERLADAIGVPIRAVRGVLEELERAGILAALAAEDRESGLQLGRPAERITVSNVLAAVRGKRDPQPGQQEVQVAIRDLLEEIERGAYQGPGSRTLTELLEPLRPAV